MSSVKWIKVVVDIFDDEKILLIESMPEADALIVIWFKLLCLAGKQNNRGVFLINDRIPYTDEMLATIFRRPLNTIRLALDAFETFGMIERINDTITIPNWDKHQSLDAIDKKREADRLRMAAKRAEQKAIAEKSRDSSATVGDPSLDGRVVDKKETRKRKDKSKDIYGTFGNVRLTPDEYSSLIDKHGEDLTRQAIDYLDAYIEEKDYKSKSHYLALGRWVFDAIQERKPKKPTVTENKNIDLNKLKSTLERI